MYESFRFFWKPFMGNGICANFLSLISIRSSSISVCFNGVRSSFFVVCPVLLMLVVQDRPC